MQESKQLRRTVRLIAAVLGGALVAGVVVGVVARLLMSGILFAAGMPTSFSAGERRGFSSSSPCSPYRPPRPRPPVPRSGTRDGGRRRP
nr:hypothetical protein GCM10020093_058150 [Planobispora longispora]